MPKEDNKAKLIITNPAHNPSIYWATGFWTTDSMTYLETSQGERILFVTPFEIDQARLKVKKGIEVAPNADIVSLEKVLALRGIKTITIPETFPSKEYQYLTKRGYELEIVSEFFSGQVRKSKKEISCIKRSQRAAEGAFSSVVTLIANAQIKNGVLCCGKELLTSENVRFHILQLLASWGYACPLDVIVASGRQSYYPHHYGSGPLKANAPIVIDIFPQSLSTHYWGDFTRTVVKGMAGGELRKMYGAVRTAQKRVLEKIRAGIDFRALDASARTYFKKRGFESSRTAKVGFIHGLGHRVGLEIHEGPSLFSEQSKLQMGDTITIEPGLYYPHIGGVRIEDLVVVAENGCDVLGTIPTKLLEL